MKKAINTCSLLTFIVLLGLVGCKRPEARVEEKNPVNVKQPSDERGFDPLEFPRDRLIVPKENPRAGNVLGTAIVSTDSTNIATVQGGTDVYLPKLSHDTLNNQAYRIQLATTKLYGEARRIVTIAEEIFDQPIFVDFEVPYFKVRVGQFGKRTDAEDYRKKCKSAGYANAWVVVVNLNVKGVAPLYDDLPPLIPEDSLSDEPVGETGD